MRSSVSCPVLYAPITGFFARAIWRVLCPRHRKEHGFAFDPEFVELDVAQNEKAPEGSHRLEIKSTYLDPSAPVSDKTVAHYPQEASAAITQLRARDPFAFKQRRRMPLEAYLKTGIVLPSNAVSLVAKNKQILVLLSRIDYLTR